jgi:hypothetical protein
VSPLRLDRHGVTVPFRVLLDSEVARLSGSSLPARPWHPQNAWPTRYSVHRPCSRTRLLEHSSPGVRTSFTVLPKPLPTTSRSGAPLLGFFAPSAHKEERVHVLPGCSGESLPVAQQSPSRLASEAAPVTRGCWQGPSCQLRCRSQVFPTSQRTFSSLCRPAIFQAGGALGVHTLQGFVPSAKPQQLVAAGVPS